MSSFQSLPRPTKTYHTTTYDRIAKQHGFEGKGKSVLITGGAKGIGYSISEAFAEAGVARIAIVSRSSGPQEKAKAELKAAYPQVQILLYQASITDSARMEEIFKDLGTVDVLVLCASHFHRRAKAAELESQEIADVFDTNVIAAFNIAKAYLATALPPSGRKTIINLSSAACQMRAPLRAGYGPSKAAVTQMMQHFAYEHEQEDLKIISFHPGSFYTPAIAEVYAEGAFKWDDIKLPAHFARWLAGSESDFLHGRYVWAHWDVDELIALKERIISDKPFMTIGLVL
ncbi:putative NADP(+)-dependent dehydrogenase [Lophiotrema nucula]|uniref:Putative NADP(+)-dependent dehydrogenase n=1 Tax=Lophiotrema nucula TaxID=690887 RepID=A0A6A5ZH09_9PLEO|nr:putative NADP(+)-dependent dehydrogenase [Lophiotrema nucula]